MFTFWIAAKIVSATGILVKVSPSKLKRTYFTLLNECFVILICCWRQCTLGSHQFLTAACHQQLLLQNVHYCLTHWDPLFRFWGNVHHRTEHLNKVLSFRMVRLKQCPWSVFPNAPMMREQGLWGRQIYGSCKTNVSWRKMKKKIDLSDSEGRQVERKPTKEQCKSAIYLVMKSPQQQLWNSYSFVEESSIICWCQWWWWYSCGSTSLGTTWHWACAFTSELTACEIEPVVFFTRAAR